VRDAWTHTSIARTLIGVSVACAFSVFATVSSAASAMTEVCQATGDPKVPYVPISVPANQLPSLRGNPHNIVPAPAAGCPATAPAASGTTPEPSAKSLPSPRPVAGSSPTHAPTAVSHGSIGAGGTGGSPGSSAGSSRSTQATGAASGAAGDSPPTVTRTSEGSDSSGVTAYASVTQPSATGPLPHTGFPGEAVLAFGLLLFGTGLLLIGGTRLWTAS